MRALPLILLCSLCFCQLIVAQSPELKTRTSETEAAKQQVERRITLDLQVTDPAGKPVRGLLQKDFQLLDQGNPQPITSFREVSGASGQPPVQAILLLDVMNATFEDVGILRHGIDAFLKRDNGKLALPISIVFLTDKGIKIDKPTRDGIDLATSLAKLQTPLRVLDSSQGISGAIDRFQRSLQALEALAEYESTQPGRKLLLWMGPGWPLLAGQRTSSPSPQDAERYYSSIVAATTSLRRAHITLYSVAPLNLYHDAGMTTFLYQDYLKGVATPAQADSPDLGVQVLAVHSGGLVLNKNGDLPGQIDRCLADADSFYELTFDAAAGNALGQYHAIEVKVDQPGVGVRTNSAYYAGPPQNTAEPARPEHGEITSQAAVPTLRAQTRLVVLDVTVLDKEGQPVSGLKASDFQLQEDGTAQTIRNAEEHKTAPIAAAPQDPTAAENAPLVLSNKPPPGAVWNVVAVDLWNTPVEERGHLQQQLERFAGQLPSGTPVALVAMTGKIRVLSSFPAGPAGLVRALKQGLGPLETGVPANIVEREAISEVVNNDPATLENKANVDIERQAERAQTTLSDFTSIAHWLKPYPGRKNVFWLSAGFPLEGQPFGVLGYTQLNPNGPATQGGRRLPMQEKTDKELETARIAIYPIDVRGVAISDIAGETNADTTGNFLDMGKNGDRLINATKDDALKAAQKSEMLDIASATGGVARFNNDLTKTLADAFAQAETYYTLSYTPTNPTWNGAYRRIQLAVDQPGTQLVYRRGYYARDAAPDPSPTREQFVAAMEPGAAPASSLQFTAKIVPAADSLDVQFAIRPSGVQFGRDSEGNLTAEIDCAALQFDANGKVLDKSLVLLSEKTTPDQLAQLTSKPWSANQTIARNPKATTLTLGIQDRATGRFGTLQVDISTH